MSESKYTPGPWAVCVPAFGLNVISIEQDAALIEGEPSIIGEIDLSGVGIDDETGAANARLISAAPELLDVASRLVAWSFGRRSLAELDEITREAGEASDRAEGRS